MKNRMLQLARMYRAYSHKDITLSWLVLAFAAKLVPYTECCPGVAS